MLMLTVWGALMVVGAFRATVGAGDAFVLFRQVTIPALLILVGLALTPHQWWLARRATIYAGVANAAYMSLEVVGVRLLDPARLATFNEARAVIRDGLPSYYHLWTGDSLLGSLTPGETITRLGGTLLNPPMAGLLMAAAFVLLYREQEFKGRRFWLVALGAGTLLTFSRGGWLVVIAAVVLPYLLAHLGRIGALVIVTPVVVFVATQFADQGNSAAHADGLVTGLNHAATYPLGLGFGSVGNYLKGQGLTYDSESLLGIAFSAAGIGAVLLAAVLTYRLWWLSREGRHLWEAPLALGVVVAAFVSETAGGLNGTIALWLAAGVALRRAHDLRRADHARPGERTEVARR